MSFVDKIKVAGKDRPDGETLAPPLFDELAAAANPMEATVRLGPGTLSPPLQDTDLSIISDAVPSELSGDFNETRLPGDRREESRFASGLPLIGAWPLARQQRALIILFALGLLGLLASAVLALTASNRSAKQVGAIGQAQTQSQRLAKSVSQALLGSAPAFVEVRESSDLLARNVRSLKTGEGDVPAVSGGLQDTSSRCCHWSIGRRKMPRWC